MQIVVAELLVVFLRITVAYTAVIMNVIIST